MHSLLLITNASRNRNISHRVAALAGKTAATKQNPNKLKKNVSKDIKPTLLKNKQKPYT